MIKDWQGKIWEYRENIYDWIKISYNRWTTYTSWQQFPDNKWCPKEEIIIPKEYKTFWWWLTQILIGPVLKISPQYDITTNSIGKTSLIWETIPQYNIIMNSIGKPSLTWQISPQCNVITNSIGKPSLTWGVSPQYDIATNSIGKPSLMWQIFPQYDIIIGEINVMSLEWQISPQYDIIINKTPTKWYGYTSWQTLAGESGKWYGG